MVFNVHRNHKVYEGWGAGGRGYQGGGEGDYIPIATLAKDNKYTVYNMLFHNFKRGKMLAPLAEHCDLPNVGQGVNVKEKTYRDSCNKFAIFTSMSS